MSPNQTKLSFVDLFAGCGGLAYGFLQEGFGSVGAVELDPNAAATYRLNIDSAIHVRDIAEVNRSSVWPAASVVIGGPPCQGFSQLGSRDPDDPRNRLWEEYVKVLDQTGADVFVMENVPALFKSPQFAQLIRAVTSDSRGYLVSYGVLNAADYGVPQNRRRAIVIGSRVSRPDLPEPTHGPLGSGRKPYVTVAQALANLPATPDGKNWHRGRPGIQPSSLVRYAAVPQNGGNRFEMQATLEARGLGHLVPRCWRDKTSGTTDVFGRLWWDRPSSTVRTEFFKPEKGRYLHPEEHRPVTPREAARLQSFPDSFAFPEEQSTVSVARQIGNAVPVDLGRALARHVRAHLAEGRTMVTSSAAPTSRSRQLVLMRV